MIGNTHYRLDSAPKFAPKFAPNFLLIQIQKLVLPYPHLKSS